SKYVSHLYQGQKLTMNMQSRLKKSKAIQRLKELHKTKANGDFLSAHQAANSSEKCVADKQHEIANILTQQSQHLNGKNSLNPMLMQMHAHYLSEQYQQLDTLLGILQEKNKELDSKRIELARSM